MSNKKEQTKENEVEEALENTNVNDECNETEGAAEAQDEAAAESEVEQLKKQISEIQDAHLRLRAEFENYKKRTIKEKAEIIKSASEGVFMNIIPLVDDFERGIQAAEKASDVESIKEGLMLIYDKFVKFLEQNNVKEIDTKDQTFDTDFHEAITAIPAQSEEQKGKIIDCVQKGYTLNDKVIRYAKVVVAQ
ncbi:MAG: nucleotide exchange factor GrpE [Paludibacteraceae bacterium]|nr:nucleotide exchange factor GrpE [Paludibacteraceae bacterium]MBP5742918.1 nucleotide exchange factor GrpE [Paludibacteraceae bacterium]